MVCHKTLGGVRQTCAGAVGLMAKAGRLPIIARLALATGHISDHDIQQSAALVIDLMRGKPRRSGRGQERGQR